MMHALSNSIHPEIIGLSITEAAERMASGQLTSVQLTSMYLDRIAALDSAGPTLGSVLEVNPDALAIAESLDQERAAGSVRGPMHGIPVLVKDNIDTGDSMHTTAGSLALMNSTPPRDATVVAQLRAAGAVILGKANLSEWANFRGSQSTSGWSARGITRNPHCLPRNPSGSSSGSAAAVAADLAIVALGTETHGSIICPGSVCGVVGHKPTVGLTSRAGVIPISHSMDSVGVFGKTVADVAISLSVMTGLDDRDLATQDSAEVVGTDFLALLDANSLRGARLGVPTNFGLVGYSAKMDALFHRVKEVLTALGAVLVPVAIPTAGDLQHTPDVLKRMEYEFKRGMDAYLAERGDPEFRTLADIIAFNVEHADTELRYFGQETLIRSEATGDHDPEMAAAIDARLKRLSRDEGMDALLTEYDLDAIIAPAMGPAAMTDPALGEKYQGDASALPAIAGYPIVTVPSGRIHGLPVGLSFMGTAWSDARLLSLAYAWEQATGMYRTPTFAEHDIAADPATPVFEFPELSAEPSDS